jgi:hypothetical protein
MEGSRDDVGTAHLRSHDTPKLGQDGVLPLGLSSGNVEVDDSNASQQSF